MALRTSVPGVATGLAWTPVGGDILFIEATRMPGNGKLILTGQLGDVMKESAQAALTLVKARAASACGATRRCSRRTTCTSTSRRARYPKDGPSAGVAMFLALASLLSTEPVRNDVAMTGEISLRGLVLPIGGVKEKALAALRAGIDTVLLPARNQQGSRGHPRGGAQAAQVRLARDHRRRAARGDRIRSRRMTALPGVSFGRPVATAPRERGRYTRPA